MRAASFKRAVRYYAGETDGFWARRAARAAGIPCVQDVPRSANFADAQRISSIIFGQTEPIEKNSLVSRLGALLEVQFADKELCYWQLTTTTEDPDLHVVGLGSGMLSRPISGGGIYKDWTNSELSMEWMGPSNVAAYIGDLMVVKNFPPIIVEK